MAAHGRRAKGGRYHVVTIRFAQLALPNHTELFDHAEMLRRRRHQVTYGTSFLVTDQEVRATMELAEKLAPILEEAALKTLEAAEKKKP